MSKHWEKELKSEIKGNLSNNGSHVVEYTDLRDTWPQFSLYSGRSLFLCYQVGSLQILKNPLGTKLRHFQDYILDCTPIFIPSLFMNFSDCYIYVIYFYLHIKEIMCNYTYLTCSWKLPSSRSLSASSRMKRRMLDVFK